MTARWEIKISKFINFIKVIEIASIPTDIRDCNG